MKNLKRIFCISLIVVILFNFIGINYYSFAEANLNTPYESNKNYKLSENDIDGSLVNQLYNINTATIPSKFSLREYIHIPVGDQKNLNISEIFSTLKSVETNYALKYGVFIDLSERYVDYMTSKYLYGETRTPGTIDGNVGNRQEGSKITTNEVMTFLETFGATTEEKVPFQNYSLSEYSEFKNKKTDLRVTSSVELPDIQNISDKYKKNRWIDVVKAHIMNYGAISTKISIPNDSAYNDSTNAMYSISSNAKQAITIVGWDDNYSRNNFNTRPAENGAFICLNSWGSNWGDNGYFYVSYEDESILSDTEGVIDVAPADKYNKYSYGDKLFTNQTWKISDGKKFYGMKFKKNSGNEFLTHITIGVGGVNENTVKVYLNMQDDSFDKNKMILLEQTGSILSENGYTNISLNNPISIEGEKFAIVCEFTGNTQNLIFATSKDSNGNETSGNMYSSNGFDSNWGKSDKEFIAYAFTTNKNVVSVDMKQFPSKTMYVLGEEIDLAGCIVTVKYDTGDVQEVQLNTRNAVVTGYNSNQIGEQTVTITYQGHSFTFKVEVKNSAGTMTVKTPPEKIAYVLGEQLDLTGGIVSITYADGAVSEISMTAEGVEISGFDTNISGKQVITIKYQGLETTFEIEVKNEVVSIEVIELPAKDVYLVGERLNLKGGKIRAAYGDGTTAEIPMFSMDIKAYGYDANSITNQIVTAMYQGKTATFEVTVKNGIKNIQVRNMPTRTTYKQGENLDISGGDIEVIYADASTAIIPLNSENVAISNYKPNTVGEQVIKVSYKGKDAEYKVKVDEKFDNTIILRIIFGIVLVLAIVSLISYIKYRKYQGIY